MIAQLRPKSRRRPVLFAALALMAALVAVPMASAQETGSGTVLVTATNVDSATLEVVVHDSTFVFGQICSQPTADPCNPDPTAYHSTQGNPASGQGVWWYMAPTTPNLVTVTSSEPWSGTVAASENTGAGASPTMTIASGALKFGPNTSLTPPINYSIINGVSTTAFTTGGAAWPSAGEQTAGTDNFYYIYYLRSDLTDAAGTFSSTVTYTVTN